MGGESHVSVDLGTGYDEVDAVFEGSSERGFGGRGAEGEPVMIGDTSVEISNRACGLVRFSVVLTSKVVEVQHRASGYLGEGARSPTRLQ
jgi:hypothetical protein